jgi:histidinol-phosphate aminotransferase
LFETYNAAMKIRNAVRKIGTYHAGKRKTGAIKLSSNENALGTSPEALKRIESSLDSLNLYPDPMSVDLRSCLAAAYGLTPGQIIVGNGSDDIMNLIAGAFVEKGRNVVTSAHTFSVYTLASQLFEGEMRYAPMKDGAHDLGSISGLIDGSTAAVFICNPNNPTGTYVKHDELVDFLEGIPKDILIVIDEAYADYTEAGDFPDCIELSGIYGNLFVLRTFSKIYGLAGLRVGFGYGHTDVIEQLYKVKAPFNVNSLAQAAAAAALEDTDFLDKSIRNNEKGKTYLYGELERLGLGYYPSQANFICIDLGRDCRSAFETLLKMGVVVRALHSFGLPNQIRVTIGTPDQNRFFIEKLNTYLESTV